MAEKVKLLYAEDDKDQADLLKMSFRRYDKLGTLEIDVAQSVEEAIVKIDRGAYHAAMLDWNLTDGLGLDVAAHIRAQNNSCPIIFLSGIWTQELIEQAKQYPPAECLDKGYGRSHCENISKLIYGMQTI